LPSEKSQFTQPIAWSGTSPLVVEPVTAGALLMMEIFVLGTVEW
jgi:hypothetical protein